MTNEYMQLLAEWIIKRVGYGNAYYVGNGQKLLYVTLVPMEC